MTVHEPHTLYPEQQEAIDKMLLPESEGACCMASMVGTGKTTVCVEFVKQSNAKTVLLIAPLQTLGHPGDETNNPDGWHGTFVRQGVRLPFRQIDSTKAGKKAFEDYQWMVPGVYFVGQEMFVRMASEKKLLWLKNKDADGNPIPRLDKNRKQMHKVVYNHKWDQRPDVIIFDEVHRAQNHTSRTLEMLMHLRAGFKIGASGTWFGNNFDGAYGVTKFLWPHLAEKNIYDWRQKWAETVYDPFAVRNQKTVGERDEGAFAASLPCYIRIESDIEERVTLVEEDVWVDLTPAQRKVYDDLDARMVAWVRENPLVVKFPITKRIRQRQVTLAFPDVETLVVDGEAKTEVSFDRDAESSKIDALHQIIEDHTRNEAVLIFTDSRLFADVLVWRLNDRYGDGSARPWVGGMSHAVKQQNKQDFVDGKFRFMVAVIAAAGTGLNSLQTVCRNMVYMSIAENRIENDQSLGRLLRNGQFSDRVNVWRILARDTIDSGQLSNQLAAAISANKSMKARARRVG